MPYVDDPDQLPELPDPGPRDGRHGVDRDADYDPFPPLRLEPGSAIAPLRASIADAATHLGVLVDRVENGEDVILIRNGHQVAKLTTLTPRGTPGLAPPAEAAAQQTEAERDAATEAAARDAEVAEEAEAARDAAAARKLPPVYEREFEGEDQLPELPDPGPRDGRHGVDGTAPVKRRGQRLPR